MMPAPAIPPAIAFKRQHVGGDSIEEPAIVADHHGAAGELQQHFFVRAQRIDVEIGRGRRR